MSKQPKNCECCGKCCFAFGEISEKLGFDICEDCWKAMSPSGQAYLLMMSKMIETLVPVISAAQQFSRLADRTYAMDADDPLGSPPIQDPPDFFDLEIPDDQEDLDL